MRERESPFFVFLKLVRFFFLLVFTHMHALDFQVARLRVYREEENREEGWV